MRSERDELAARLVDLLAVVEDEQRGTVGQVAHERRRQRLAGQRADPELVGDRRGDCFGVRAGRRARRGSTNQAPSANRVTQRAASCSASRVLPQPPAPISVIELAAGDQARDSRASSCVAADEARRLDGQVVRQLAERVRRSELGSGRIGSSNTRSPGARSAKRCSPRSRSSLAWLSACLRVAPTRAPGRGARRPPAASSAPVPGRRGVPDPHDAAGVDADAGRSRMSAAIARAACNASVEIVERRDEAIAGYGVAARRRGGRRCSVERAEPAVVAAAIAPLEDRAQQHAVRARARAARPRPGWRSAGSRARCGRRARVAPGRARPSRGRPRGRPAPPRPVRRPHPARGRAARGGARRAGARRSACAALLELAHARRARAAPR